MAGGNRNLDRMVDLAKEVFAELNVRDAKVAVIGADVIRRGIDPGLAYHVGHVLECGALACDPGSPSDCLVAEICDDNTAIFIAPNPARRCMAYSVAAH